MSKFTDFYPAASGVGFPFTGSAGMTGSLNTDVLGVEGGVAFSYNDVGTTQGWTTLAATMNAGRVGVASDGTYYAAIAAGGETPARGTYVANSETWDGTSFSNIASLNATRGRGSGAGTQNSFGTFAGRNAGTSPLNTHEEWNGTSWTALAATMNTGRQQLASAATSKDEIVAFGGVNPAITAATEEYNGTSWTAPGNNLPAVQRGHGGTGNATAALSSGGASANPAFTLTGATYLYNGVTWANPGHTLTTPRFGLGLSGQQTNAVGYGGSTPAAATSVGNTETYDGASWSNLSPTILMNTARTQMGKAGNIQRALSFGGETPTVTNVTEEYQGQTTSAGLYETFNFSEQTGITTVSKLIETSAERYKDNIQPLDNQLDKVKQLNPVQYTWKRNAKQDIGFIAEEVQNIYPELINKNEEGEIEGMNYSHLVSALVKSLQEQQDQLNALNQKLNDLDNE
jgi:hypothetical protein